MHTEGTGVEVISYNGWDDAYTQYNQKYVAAGHVRPQIFLDATTTDFYNWRISGSGWYSQTSVVGTNGKIYWMEAYSYNDNEIKSALRRTINGDTTPPYCNSAYPASGATNVDTTTNVSCHMLDAGSGVDQSSVTFQVLVGSSPVAGNLSYTGNFLDYTLLFDPTSNLPDSTLITVRVNGKDLFNNAMTQYQWTFTTGSSGLTPASFGTIKTLYR